MPRNLDRRVECLFPVESPDMRRRVVSAILPVHLGDNVQCGELEPSGEYRRLEPNGAPHLDSQRWMIDHPGAESANCPGSFKNG